MARGPISLIVAMDRNGVIGRDGDVPWRLPTDLRTFRTITMGKPVVMGRKTWESLPAPLAGRTNIVVTSRRDYQAEEGVVVHSPDEALARARAEAGGSGEVVVAGGATIYRQFLPVADRIYMTLVEVEVPGGGDTYFPSVDWGVWKTAYELCVDDPEDEHPYTFKVLRRG